MTFFKNLIAKQPLSLILIGLFLLVALTGIKGVNDPVVNVQDLLTIQQNSPDGYIGTPFEFSRARTQFLQVISLYERGSFIFTQEEASATTPDAGYYRGIFRSLAPPGLSILMYPFFLLGTFFGFGQLLSYVFLIALYGLSIYFFFLVLKELITSQKTALLGATIYGFATPGIIYASSPLYHSFSLFGITLLSLWTLKISQNPQGMTRYFIYTNIFVGLSVFVEYAHPLIFLPFYITQLLILRRSDIQRSCGFTRTFFLSLIIPLLCIGGLLLMQKTFFGNPFQMTNTQLQFNGENLITLPEETLEFETARKNRLDDFVGISNITRNTKDMFFQGHRGFFTMSPLLLLGILGIPLWLKRRRSLPIILGPLFFSGLITFLVYASFVGGRGDYSVGLRYLIPLIPFFVALLTLLISSLASLALRWKIVFTTLFLPLLFWSFLSHLSAFYTTIYSSHRESAHHLGIMQWNYLTDETTSSYWFNYIYSTLPLMYYPIIISALLTLLSGYLLINNWYTKKNHD